ncbi:MAG: ATP-binding protein, partial [Thermoanaerobaculia bacterium]|nr:ATP-binding protein [Thermoanaerobaculia bacterium]
AFLFRVTRIEGIQEMTSTSPSAAAALVLLSVGVLFADPKHGMAKVLVSENAAGRMVRWFMPTALGGTLLVGLVISLTVRAGFFSHSFAVAVFVELEMILLGFLIWRSACQLQEIDDERASAVEELRRSHDELEERVEGRTEELRRLNQELESFSYSISHDLRAPLRAIDGYSRMLEEDYEEKLDDEGKRYLEVIRSSVRTMGQLISDLLTFSRVSRQEITTTPVDLGALAREVFESIAIERTHEQQFLLEDDPPLAEADPTLMRQVLQNLLANAVKYSEPKPGGTIRFGAERVDGENRYYVSDEGVGFDPSYSEKLFGVFQRLHHQDEFEGTGVGLSIVKKIVEKHGGTVGAESELGSGSTFYFSLPKTKDREASHERS